MRLSDISIKNSVFAWMLFFAFIVFGLISFERMGISQLPDVDFPVINVALTLSGAAPEIMETTVVDPVEDALSSVEGVTRITSASKTGIANITIEFELDRNIDSALQEVQTKVAQAQRLLPTNVDPPVISKTNPDDQPIIWLALTYEKKRSVLHDELRQGLLKKPLYAGSRRRRHYPWRLHRSRPASLGKTERAKPVSTSFATIAAAVPSAVATGAGSETFRPMAITLIGGVLVSTMLTLYVVPVVYSLLDRFRKTGARKDEVKEAFDHVGETALER